MHIRSITMRKKKITQRTHTASRRDATFGKTKPKEPSASHRDAP